MRQQWRQCASHLQQLDSAGTYTFLLQPNTPVKFWSPINLPTSVSWNVSPYSLVDRYQRSEKKPDVTISFYPGGGLWDWACRCKNTVFPCAVAQVLEDRVPQTLPHQAETLRLTEIRHATILSGSTLFYIRSVKRHIHTHTHTHTPVSNRFQRITYLKIFNIWPSRPRHKRKQTEQANITAPPDPTHTWQEQQLRHLRFSQRCWWTFKYSSTWHSVN
jgi:hypothetical protein